MEKKASITWNRKIGILRSNNYKTKTVIETSINELKLDKAEDTIKCLMNFLYDDEDLLRLNTSNYNDVYIEINRKQVIINYKSSHILKLLQAKNEEQVNIAINLLCDNIKKGMKKHNKFTNNIVAEFKGEYFLGESHE